MIDGCRLGDDGLPPDAEERFPAIGEHISTTERRAAAAERDAGDRFIAAFLAKRVGEILAGRVTGVTRFGLFVRLADTGADGLVPISSLPSDFYDHDERNHALVGRRWGRTYRLGERVAVRLVQAEASDRRPAARAHRGRERRLDAGRRTGAAARQKAQQSQGPAVRPAGQPSGPPLAKARLGACLRNG